MICFTKRAFRKTIAKVAAGKDRRDSIKIIFCLFCFVKYPSWQNSQWILIITRKHNSVNGDLSLKEKKPMVRNLLNTQWYQYLSQLLMLYPFPGLSPSFQIYENYSPGNILFLISKPSSSSKPCNLYPLRPPPSLAKFFPSRLFHWSPIFFLYPKYIYFF